MSPESWRIVLVSQYVGGVLVSEAACSQLGHLPVGHLFVRGGIRHEQLNALVTQSPGDLALLVPARRSQIAPLLRVCEPDLVVCGGFPWLIPPDALAVPRLGAINLHPSLLPRNRGPLPVHWALRNGDAELGVTVHRMDESFDTGAILAQATTPIEDDDGEAELYAKMAGLIPELFSRAFARIAAGDPGDPQDEAAASYAGLMEPAYRYVDWSSPARDIHNQVRVWRTHPTEGPPGAIAELDGERIRILRTRLTPGEGRAVQCGDGTIWVVETDPES